MGETGVGASGMRKGPPTVEGERLVSPEEGDSVVGVWGVAVSGVLFSL